MIPQKTIGAIAMAILLILAGCSSGVPGTDTQVQTDQSSDDVESVDDGSSSDDGDDVSLTFYVSDRPGAIDDFEHLNVTITKIGLHKTGDGDGDDGEDADDGSANDTTDESIAADDDTETTTAEEPNETTEETTSTDSNEEDSEDEEETEDEEESEEEETEDEESESDDDDGESESEDDESDSGWVTHDVDNETADLTNLQGANATAIGNVSVPADEYDKVFVYVSEVNATLKNGDSVNVKLPSSKLQINKAFTLGANSSADFVFDINVHEAGGSGKYILQPVISETGTGDQVEIEKVDKDGKPENPGEKGERDKDDGDEDETDTEESDDDQSDDDRSDVALEAALDGQVRAGEQVSLTVTDGDGAVENATVAVNGEVVGETDGDGTVTFEVPDAEDIEVKVTAGDAELEQEWDVKGGGNGNGQRLAPTALA